MYDIECSGKKLARDKEGFLLHPEEWDEDVAEILAAEEGLAPFNEEQRAIINFLRSYYFKFNAFPILNAVCKRIGQERECVNEKFIDPMKAWKIAGLPKLEGIHFITVDGKNFLMEECC